MSRKRILALTSRIPFPPLGGEKLKTFHSLRALAGAYEVDWLSLHDGKALSDSQSLEFEQFKKNFRSVEIITQPKWQSLWHTALSPLKGDPLQINYFFNREFQKAVNQKLSSVDGALAFLIRTARYLENYQGPKILDMTDSISSHYQEAVEKADSLLWKMIYRYEAPKLRFFEEKAVTEFNATLFVNKQEAQSYSSSEKCIWLPLGVSKNLLLRPRPQVAAKPTLSFLGKMNYQPNVEAVIWFCREVMPLLSAEFQFVIVGAEPSEEVKKLAEKDPRVQVTGFLDDPFEILQKSWAVVAPLQIGGGIQNKVLEAMALGCPVLMTSKVQEPIGCPAETCRVLNQPEEWAQFLKNLNQPSVLSEMGTRAREWMRFWGDWDDYERKYTSEVSKIFGR